MHFWVSEVLLATKLIWQNICFIMKLSFYNNKLMIIKQKFCQIKFKLRRGSGSRSNTYDAPCRSFHMKQVFTRDLHLCTWPVTIQLFSLYELKGHCLGIICGSCTSYSVSYKLALNCKKLVLKSILIDLLIVCKKIMYVCKKTILYERK